MKKVNRLIMGLICMAIVAGFSACATLRSIFIAPIYGATLWVNGEAQILSDSSSQANSVFAYGDDVYVAGRIWDSSTESSRAALWVNGELQTLSSDPSLARSVFVYNNIVYVVGSQNQSATLWINGVAQTLNIPQTHFYSEAVAVYVSATDIYVVGIIYQWRDPDFEWTAIDFSDESRIQGSRAILWVNGTAQISDRESMAHDMHVSGNDIYVTGSIFEGTGANRNRRAALWVNGVPQALRGRAAHGDSVFVSGSDVFVMGVTETRQVEGARQWRETGRPTLWKNGEPEILRQRPSEGGTLFVAHGRSVARSVFVSGNDVYVSGAVEHFVGMQQQGTRRATLWVNGEPQTLYQRESNARAVFVSGNNVFVAGLVRIN